MQLLVHKYQYKNTSTQIPVQYTQGKFSWEKRSHLQCELYLTILIFMRCSEIWIILLANNFQVHSAMLFITKEPPKKCCFTSRLEYQNLFWLGIAWKFEYTFHSILCKSVGSTFISDDLMCNFNVIMHHYCKKNYSMHIAFLFWKDQIYIFASNTSLLPIPNSVR